MCYLVKPIKANKNFLLVLFIWIMIDLFTEMQKERGDNKYVFLGNTGNQFEWLEKPFKGALTAAGIKNLTFHGTRHTFASHFVMRGGDLLSLEEILGHSTMKMVERYFHLAPSHKRTMMNNLNFSDKNCHISVTWD